MNRRQTIPKHLRYTINDFNRQFPDNDACIEHLKEQRFPGGIAYCGKCQQEQKHHRIKGRPVYACDLCLTQISPMAGTIFEHSSTPLRLWYYAMYLMASTRCGISAKQIQRETGVTYKTAWRMFRQIRSLLGSDDKLEGPATVEIDEMYVGGRTKRLHTMEKPKTPVVGAVERKGGRVIARVATDTKRATLHGFIKEYVLPGSVLFTDDYAAYDGIEGPHYRHYRVRHSGRVYVTGSRGQIHTQTIEGFWSLVKRGIGGVYHSVSTKYLQTYLDEYCFRYNRREQGNLIFISMLKRVSEMADSPLASRDRGTPVV
ncbi:MAG: IS1595 family transposase [Terriglobales bacterium]